MNTDVYSKEDREKVAKALGICSECFEKTFQHLTNKCDFIHLTEGCTAHYDADAEHFVISNDLADSNHSES